MLYHDVTATVFGCTMELLILNVHKFSVDFEKQLCSHLSIVSGADHHKFDRHDFLTLLGIGEGLGEFFKGKLYLGTMVLKQAKIASSSICGYHNLIEVKPLKFWILCGFSSNHNYVRKNRESEHLSF